MSDEKPNVTVKVSLETWPLALVILLIFAVGEPSLLEALISYLMQAKP